MEGRIEIKDRKLCIEIPFDQEYADVVILGSLDKAKQMCMQFIIAEQFEKRKKEALGGLIKPGVIQ